jgi:phosphoglycerate dehydrogenase-like enzyme
MNQRSVLALRNLPFQGDYWDRFVSIVEPDRLMALDARDDAGIAEALQHAEIALIGDDLDDRYIAAPNLKWVHVNIAGITRSARPAVFDRGLIVTGAAGRSAPALAEHAMLYMLAHCSNFLGFHEAQKRHQWGGVEGSQHLRALYGRTVGIIGLGATGLELAARAKAFGMQVLGYRRRDSAPPPAVDRVFSADKGETIDGILEESDFIVLSVNLSDETHHLIGARELKRMKPTAFLVNLSRGPVIDEDALIAALGAQSIGGAGLDVFAVEPLPADSPLWDMPNTLISPHFSAPVSDRLERTLNIIAENFRRYRNGLPMMNRITREDVYTHE